MSQRLFTTPRDDVLTGWGWPLQSLFLVVTDRDTREIVYSHLDDPHRPGLSRHAFAPRRTPVICPDPMPGRPREAQSGRRTQGLDALDSPGDGSPGCAGAASGGLEAPGCRPVATGDRSVQARVKAALSPRERPRSSCHPAGAVVHGVLRPASASVAENPHAWLARQAGG
jgi:hypothetical protein